MLAWRRVLVLLAGLLYAGAARHGFLSWDDALYVLDNPRIQAPGLSGLLHVLSPADAYAGRFVEYFPLRDAVYWGLWQAFGNNPLAFHVPSIVLNAGCAVLVLHVLELVGLSPTAALLAALLWVAHPTHVESVAWVAAVKDPMVALAYFGALACWLTSDSRRATWGALALFCVGLLCKSLILPLPATLLLVDWLRGRPLVPSLRRVVPFGVVGVGALVHFMVIGRANDVIVERVGGSLLTGAMTETWAITMYVEKLLLPVGLNLRYYVAPVLSLTDWHLWAGLLLLLTLVVVVVRSLPTARPIAFGVLFYFVALSPVLNVIPIPILVADRYQYIPSFGFVFAIGWLLERWAARVGWRVPLAVGLLVFAAYAGLVLERVPRWGSRIGLWQEALEQPGGENLAIVWNALGHAYADAGLLKQAAHCFRTVLDVETDDNSPVSALAHHRLSLVEGALGHPEEAYRHARRAHEALHDARAAISLSGYALATGRTEEAIAAGRDAMRLDPNRPLASWVLGLALDVAGDPGALALLTDALARDATLCARGGPLPASARAVAALCAGR